MDIALPVSLTFEAFSHEVLGGSWSELRHYTLHTIDCATEAEHLDSAILLEALHSIQFNSAYLKKPNQSIKNILTHQGFDLEDFELTDISKVIFIDAIFKLIRADKLFDEQVCLALFQLKVIYMILLIQDSTLLKTPYACSVVFLNRMISQSMGWHQNVSVSRWQAKRDELLKFIQVVMSSRDITEDLMKQAAFNMLESIELKNEKSSHLERRLCEAEKGRIKLQSYDEQVADCLNFNCRGIKLQLAFIGFLHGIWREVLRGVLLQASDENAKNVWRNAAQVTSLMIHSLQEKAHLKRFYSRADGIVERVEKIMESVHTDENVIEVAGDLLLNCQKEMISDIAHYEAPPLISLGKFFSDTELSISKSLMVKLEALDLNQHFCYQEEGALPVLYKLIYIDRIHQFFFFIGVESCQHWTKSFKDIAYNLSSGMLMNVELEECFPNFMNLALNKCWGCQIKSMHADKERQIEKIKVAEKKKEKINRAALELKIDEVRGLRKEYGDQIRTSSELKKKIKGIIDSLPLGAWINIVKKGESIRAKLAVRIARSDKYIFVNRSGLRVAEYKRLELVDEVINGCVELEHEGHNFERSLSHIIKRIK